MKIETKLSVGDKCFFIMHAKVMESVITYLEVRHDGYGAFITYTVKENPAGSNYTTRFSEGDIFATKEDLLKSL